MSDNSKCAVCKREISGKVVNAVGKSYHPNHFVCFQCKKVIEDKFQVHNNEPYCPTCAEKYLGYRPKRCATCGEIIEGTAISAVGKTYHADHLVCLKCKEQIGTSYRVKDNDPYCNDCFMQEFADKCFKCSQPIQEKRIRAMDHTWHPECFTCNICNVQLLDSPFSQKDGMVLCEGCFVEKYAPKCKLCGKAIQGRAVESKGHYWHIECFKCSQCGQQITEEYVFENELIVCDKCSILHA